jgi:TRAP transporter TAXI family solute receptor
MKKIIASLLVVLLVFGLVGCSSNNTAPETKEPVQEEPQPKPEEEKPGKVDEPVDLMFISMASTTAIYTYSTTIANMLLDVLPPGSTIDVPETSPGGLTAQYSIINGDTDLVVMNGISVKWSMENENGVMDLGKVTGGVSSLVNGLDMPHITILFRKAFIDKTNCSTIEDLVKNKVPANFYIKQKGNLGEDAFTQVLEALNVTEEDLISWGCTVTRDTAANIGTAFQDGLADVTIDHLPNGQAATVQLTTNTECKVVGMAEETANALAEKGWTKDIWKAGSSKFVGHDEDILTVGAPNCLIARSDLDEDLAYLITKTVCENRDKLVAASAALEVFQPEKAGEVLTEILHPGALRYYKEMGYIK